MTALTLSVRVSASLRQDCPDTFGQGLRFAATRQLKQSVIRKAIVILLGNDQMIEKLNIHKISGILYFLCNPGI
jgi:hypothetical protein